MGEQLRTLIVALSAEKDGFTPSDAEHIKASSTYVYKVCLLMIDEGLLFRVKVMGHPVNYHATAADASVWKAATIPRKAPKNGQRKIRAMALKPLDTKPIKPKSSSAALAEPIKSVYNFEIKREPWKPKVKASPPEITGWDTCKRSSQLMADRYAVSVPRQIIGTSSWKQL